MNDDPRSIEERLAELPLEIRVQRLEACLTATVACINSFQTAISDLEDDIEAIKAELYAPKP